MVGIEPGWHSVWRSTSDTIITNCYQGTGQILLFCAALPEIAGEFYHHSFSLCGMIFEISSARLDLTEWGFACVTA